MSWQRIRGHEALIQSFHRALERGRLAHAYLFTGPSGVGKRLFAQELAKTLLCESQPTDRFEACDHCSACAQVEAGSHPDFFAVSRPEENLELPIRVMQELCQALSLKPARGKRKIAVIDDADDFNEESANSFLKTLEEPPPYSLLILLGTSADRQLPTIVSRCHIIRFAPLPPAVVTDLLGEQGMTDRALIERVVRLSGGSIGQAQALADASLWDFRRTLLQGLVKPQIDSVGLGRAWMQFVEEAGKEAALQRRRAAQVLRFVIDFLHAALRLQLGAAPDLVEQEDQSTLGELANRLDTDQLLDMLERCHEAAIQIDRRVQLVLVLEALLDALGQKAGGQALTR